MQAARIFRASVLVLCILSLTGCMMVARRTMKKMARHGDGAETAVPANDYAPEYMFPQEE